MQRKIESDPNNFCKIRKRAPSSSSWDNMDTKSPSQSFGRDKGKEDKLSARRLAATLWEINGLKSPGSERGKIETLQKEDRNRIPKSGELFEPEFRNAHHLNHHSQSPVCKSKDGSKLVGHHRRKSSATSQKLQLIEYTEGEEMDSVISGGFEITTTSAIKSRLKDVSNSLTGSKEIIKALFRLLTQQGHSSSRLTLASALRVEIDRARHEVDQLILNEELYNEKDAKKSLLKRFAAEKVAWKRREQDRIVEAISSVSRELQIEKKLRRQSDRLSKRLAKELAEKKDELSKVVKKLECEKRAREILEQTYDELKTEEVEIEEKNVALERLRSDLQVYLGGKQGFDDKNSNFERNSEYGEEDSEGSELNSIELSMDSHSKSYTWSFVKDEPMRDDSVDEVFKGRRSLSEQIQWENICLQREKATSDCLEKQVCGQDERSDYKPIKERPISNKM